ncbi:MAG TPA: pyruvate kinase [Polyangiaceae bacterium]|nr:pyruvate kinase [Polyangiaceae bacterium]
MPYATVHTQPQLIATLGPSSFLKAGEMFRAGATAFRINASHMSPVQVREHLLRVRAEVGAVPCVVDLQGKKMRIGSIESRTLEIGAHLDFSNDPDAQGSVFVPHPELFEQTELGERLTLDDSRIEVEVVGRERAVLHTIVHTPGVLSGRKGINRKNHPFELVELIDGDSETLEYCRDIEGITFAVSFASDGLEAVWVRRRAPHCRVVLKVERREATERLAALAASADELWICRGDLGAQLGIAAMAHAISQIRPRSYGIPILMAGQVLQHLCTHEAPTRSEVCHLHDLLQRGYAGIVLSDETAVGRDPAAAVGWAAQLMEHWAA